MRRLRWLELPSLLYLLLWLAPCLLSLRRGLLRGCSPTLLLRLLGPILLRRRRIPACRGLIPLLSLPGLLGLLPLVGRCLILLPAILRRWSLHGLSSRFSSVSGASNTVVTNMPPDVQGNQYNQHNQDHDIKAMEYGTKCIEMLP